MSVDNPLLRSRDRHREVDHHRPLSPLGFENGSASSVSISRSLEPGTARRIARRREKKKRGANQWKKLLWVRQNYPDNYTDSSTFLNDLKRNRGLQPYEFWRLVADSTVIVQQVCSVAIFVCCFTGIFQERVSPITIVSWGSTATIGGWIAWDIWAGQEQNPPDVLTGSIIDTGEGSVNSSISKESIQSGSQSPVNELPDLLYDEYHPPTAQVYGDPMSKLSPRNQQRLATIKSAVLIYCAVLGLSPILKSLTKSTTSDSIWAISCWLFVINVLFFDYGGGVGAK